MTDRTNGFIVTLDQAYRDDDAEAILQAIRMVKGVISVELLVADPGHFMLAEQVRRDLKIKSSTPLSEMAVDDRKTSLGDVTMDLYEQLQKSPTGVLCGMSISWTTFGGDRITISNSGFFTPREARKSAIRTAWRCGWTYPRWWQFWRWGDTRPDLDFSVLPSRS